ncbi:MAG: choice-of-anchor tandem repeat GloVer-containing protein, partial [Terriglobales bacterium]
MNRLACTVFVLVTCAAMLGQAQYKVLYSFGGVPNDAAYPYGLIADSAGNLYGAGGGGTSQEGSVFELSPQAGGAWTETVLYSFCSVSNCLDGIGPEASLVLDANGNLYGTTTEGGANCANTENRCGVAFELSPPQQPGGSWTETVLYNFCSNYQNRVCLDGFEPKSQLATDAAGNLYGTTYGGGSGTGINAGIA